MTSFESAMLKPSSYFHHPRDVLKEPWTSEQKYRVLRQWKYDLGQLEVATEENMPSPGARKEPVTVAQIHEAMEDLGHPTDTDPVPTKGA